MQLRSIVDALEKIAPTSAAESWDNVGLLTGDPSQQIHQIMLTIDYSPAVAEEARDCDLVIAYHPPLFSAIKRITADGPAGLIHDAIRRGVAIYSPHTAWDVAAGGTNDLLMDALGVETRTPLRTLAAADGVLKLVTFVPEKDVERVSKALFEAGAGHIGNYSCCSFRGSGMGTFFGHEGTNPTVGQPGRLETVPEIRLETILPKGRTDAVLQALRQTHPYEEPAFDLAMLATVPMGTGPGRVGNLHASTPIEELAARLKQALNLKSLLIAGEQHRSIARVAVCAGAGGEMLDDAIKARAELFVTGELRHHDALKAIRAGLSVFCTLHSNSERPSLHRLKTRLEESVPGLPPVQLSQQDRDPFAFG
jgi:dinuclear metal center YbgI/SA1388 family protein